MKWTIKTKHLNDENEVIGLELQDEDGTFDANIKWDGAMEIHIHSKTEEGNVMDETIHTYDIDGLIAKLEGLKEVSSDYIDDFQ